MNQLLNQHCNKNPAALEMKSVDELLASIHSDWILSPDKNHISRSYEFKNYHQTIAFVNALAWVAHQENHHPDLEISYKRCTVHYTTHSAGGISENDFICAARIDHLLE